MQPLLYSFLFVLYSSRLLAQAKPPTLSANASQICLSDTLEVEYRIFNEKEAKTPTNSLSFPGFRVQGSPQLDQQSSNSLQNGSFVETFCSIYTLHLLPLKTGTFTLPAFTIKNKNGTVTRSNPLVITVVNDCNLRIADTTFHSAEAEIRKYFDFFSASDAAGLVNFKEKVLHTATPYIASISWANAQGTNPSANTIQKLQNAMSLTDSTLSHMQYERIGVAPVNFTIRGIPYLYYGITDTIGVSNSIHQVLSAARMPDLQIKFLSQQQWMDTQKLIRESSEYKLYAEIAGIANGLINSGESLKEARNIYVVFYFTKKENRAACIKWAQDRGLRAPTPQDLTDDQPGKYDVWLSFRQAAVPKDIFPKINSIINAVQHQFGSQVTYDGITMQQLNTQQNK